MGHSCCNKQKVRRGLWSPEEDEKLINHISTYGHGCWSSVPRLAGLQRCGKSCRLRWINYLRPDLKRGSFSPQEASLIIELHRVLGNRWAQIAKHLPGRTDNEVKNFWNSSLKKKLISNGVTDLTNLPDFTNSLGSNEGFFPFNANPNFMMGTQQDHFYVPSATSITEGFVHGELKSDLMDYNVDWVSASLPSQPLMDTSSYDYCPTWSLDDQPHHLHHHQDHQSTLQYTEENPIDSKLMMMPYDEPLVGSTVPKLYKMTSLDECSMPSYSTSHEVDTSTRLPSCMYDAHSPKTSKEPLDILEAQIAHLESTNHREYADSIMPSSSSSSPPPSFFSCGRIVIDPNPPSSWVP